MNLGTTLNRALELTASLLLGILLLLGLLLTNRRGSLASKKAPNIRRHIDNVGRTQNSNVGTSTNMRSWVKLPSRCGGIVIKRFWLEVDDALTRLITRESATAPVHQAA